MASDSTPSIRCVDTNQYGLSHRGASYVIEADQVGLVEAGTPRAASILLDTLQGRDVAYIYVTHVHLDHAGAAGAIAVRHPEATVIAHPRAIKHLADPRRLVEGVRSASPDLFPFYGEPTPIPQRQLHAAADGERFDLGRGAVIEAIHAPGHAPHHVCFFEHGSSVLFTGDAVGNHGVPIDVPLTVPPRFDLAAALETLDRLTDLRPTSLAFTHFGQVGGDASALFDAYRHALIAWFGRIRSLREGTDSEHVVSSVLSEPKYGALEPSDRYSIEMCVRGALATLEAQDV